MKTLKRALQERKVIIVSTVRSSANQIEFDLRHTLGFVANDRRFNGKPQATCLMRTKLTYLRSHCNPRTSPPNYRR
jgi:hypothetical protein